MQPSFESLLRLLNQISGEFHQLREGILKAIQIASIDPAMSLTRARTVLEYVVKDAFKRRFSQSAGTRPLENLLHELVKDGYMPSRINAYATSVRMLGNVGTHAFDEPVTSADVYLALTQLLPVLDWYFSEGQTAGFATAGGNIDPGQLPSTSPDDPAAQSLNSISARLQSDSSRIRAWLDPGAAKSSDSLCGDTIVVYTWQVLGDAGGTHRMNIAHTRR